MYCNESMYSLISYSKTGKLYTIIDVIMCTCSLHHALFVTSPYILSQSISKLSFENICGFTNKKGRNM